MKQAPHPGSRPVDRSVMTRRDLILFAAAEHAQRSRLSRLYKNIGIIGCAQLGLAFGLAVLLPILGFRESPTKGLVILSDIFASFIAGYVLFLLIRHRSANALIGLCLLSKRGIVLGVLAVGLMKASSYRDWVGLAVLTLTYAHVGYWISLVMDEEIFLLRDDTRWWKYGQGGYEVPDK